MTSPMTSLHDALKIILAEAKPLQQTITLPLLEALGKRLAEPLIAPMDVPPSDNSAMDGYAVSFQAVQALLSSSSSSSTKTTPLRVTLPVVQRIAAGDQPLPLGEREGALGAARIFTGADIPPGADTVVIQENCETISDHQSDQVTLLNPEQIILGQNIRRAGQDIQQGSQVLAAGTVLTAVEIGLAASLGLAELEVFKPLKIGLLSTGSELVEPGQALSVGQIYNSNRYLLSSLIRQSGHIPVDLGIVPDSLNATQTTLLNAVGSVDLLLSTGGVSVGEEDHVKQAVTQLGHLNLWKLSIKPGKPLAFGVITKPITKPSTQDETTAEQSPLSMLESVPFFGLPGNPAAALVTFLMVVRPYLLKMQGVSAEQLTPTPEKAKADFQIDKPRRRQEFVRARVYQDQEGQNWVKPFSNQSSGVLSSAQWATGLAVIPIGVTIGRGELVDVYPFHRFF